MAENQPKEETASGDDTDTTQEGQKAEGDENTVQDEESPEDDGEKKQDKMPEDVTEAMDGGLEEYEPTEEELLELFNKNTASFRCLAQILLSRSSLLRHPLYNFPPLEDPGIDEAFNYVEPEEPIDTVCAEKYRKLCKDMNIVPLSRVINSLPTKSMNLRFYGLTTKELKAVAKALVLNTYVEELNLEENFLSPESACDIEETLRENNTLKVLNMKECRIGPIGAENLSEGIMLNQSLTELDLSNNSLGTAGLTSLVNAFRENATITKLNLSRNELGLEAAPLIASILKENCALEDLDLSWNNFGSPAAMKTLFKDGVSQNRLLRSLNLAWNGISMKLAVKPMTIYIKSSETLEFLDLSNNRICDPVFNMVKNAVGKNKTLRGLNLSFNPLTPANAYAMAELMLSNKSPPNFQVLDMENVFVKKDFVPLWKRATKRNKNIKITGILGNWVIKGPNVPKLLFDRARLLALKPKKKKLRKDFSHFVLALPDKPMRKGTFDDEAKKFKMKTVDKDLLGEIVKLFPYKKKAIDCTAMKEKYMELYPDAQPAPKKKAKGKRKKGKGKTDAAESPERAVTEQVQEGQKPDVEPGAVTDDLEKKLTLQTTQTEDQEGGVVTELVDVGERELVQDFAHFETEGKTHVLKGSHSNVDVAMETVAELASTDTEHLYTEEDRRNFATPSGIFNVEINDEKQPETLPTVQITE